MNFAALGLAPELLHAAKNCGFTVLTPVQEQAIPPGRRGRDLLVTAQTGTGKTAAYGFALLQQLMERPRDRQPRQTRALVLAPTRELVEQVAANLQHFAQQLPITVTAIFGGVRVSSQTAKLSAGTDILVATPGRLLEHMELGNIELGQVAHLVLDEADRMLDMGFVGEISQVLNRMGKKPQVMLFSATLTNQLNQLAKEILQRPLAIAVSKRNTVADTVDHLIYPVDQARKYDLFIELLRTENWYQVMAFSSTREEADKLLMALKNDGVAAAVIHSEKTQGARRRALQEFKDGKLQVLVATEVAARGLDIQGLEQVVNLDLPFFTEDYVHRVGRTGRAGAKGIAISLVSPADESKVAAIEKVIGARIKRIRVKGYEITESAPVTDAPKTRFAKAVSNKRLPTSGKKVATKNTAGKKPPANKGRGAPVKSNSATGRAKAPAIARPAARKTGAGRKPTR